MGNNIKKEKNSFSLVCFFGIILLFVLCIFGANSPIKGTRSELEPVCPSGYAWQMTVSSEGIGDLTTTTGNGICCPNGITEYVKRESDGKYICYSGKIYDEDYYEFPNWSLVNTNGKGTYYCIKTLSDPNSNCDIGTKEVKSGLLGLEKRTQCVTSDLNVCAKYGVSAVKSCWKLEDGSYEWSYISSDLRGVNATEEDCKNYDSGWGNRCYDGGHYYYWGTAGSGNPPVVSKYKTKSECEAVNKCCYDATKSKYVWGVYTTGGTISCTSDPKYNSKVTCEAANNGGSCYKCSSAPDIYAWATSSTELSDDRNFCPSGDWSSTSDDKTSCSSKKAGYHKLTFNMNDGTSSVETKKYDYTVGSKSVNVDLHNVSRNGYDFLGWDTNDSCTGPVTGSTSVDKSMTYYACWNKKNSGGGNPSTNKTITATFMNGDIQFATTTCNTSGGSSCTIPAPNNNPIKDGYTFKGWGTNGCSDGWIGSKNGVSNNTTFYACWDGANVGNNPTTGDITIALIWFIGILAIGYSIYYFDQVKEN